MEQAASLSRLPSVNMSPVPIWARRRSPLYLPALVFCHYGRSYRNKRNTHGCEGISSTPFWVAIAGISAVLLVGGSSGYLIHSIYHLKQKCEEVAPSQEAQFSEADVKIVEGILKTVFKVWLIDTAISPHEVRKQKSRSFTIGFCFISFWFYSVILVVIGGFEPPTPALWVLCSNQLSYITKQPKIISFLRRNVNQELAEFNEFCRNQWRHALFVKLYRQY